VTDFVPPRKGDLVRVSVEGVVEGVGNDFVKLTVGDTVDHYGSVYWSEFVIPQVMVLRPSFRPGDVADIMRSNGVVERAMFVRYANGDDDAWVTAEGHHLRGIRDLGRIALVFPAECGEGF
jgi:hypothetical protein